MVMVAIGAMGIPYGMSQHGATRIVNFRQNLLNTSPPQRDGDVRRTKGVSRL